jgi:hypothetical protein
MSTENKPRYRHDCEDCKPLGQFEQYDLYFCEQGFNGQLNTVIARFSDRGADYISGLCFADQIPAIGEAKKRAEAQGYI